MARTTWLEEGCSVSGMRSKSTNPPSDRRPGGHGPRSGELKATRKLDPNAKRPDAAARLRVMRDPLWEIQPGETTRAYDRFRMYRDLGPSRTQKRAAELVGISGTQMADLSSKYRWVERVRAYDAYLDTMILGAQEAALREGARSWVARTADIREMEYEVAMGLADKVREMLAYPIRRVTRSMTTKNGKTTYLTIVEPARWDWKSAADILSKIGYQARLSADMVTDGARAPTPDMTDRGVADIDAWLADIGINVEAQEQQAREERGRS